MHGAQTRGAAAYRDQHIQTRSPLELVVLLYSRAIDRVAAARAASERGDIRARREALSRAIAIVSELQNTLDLERGGDIAARLDALYAYMTTRLLDVTAKGDVAAFDEVERLLATLREAWTEIAGGAAR